MLLKGCFHTYKTCSCGKIKPLAVFDSCQERGINFIDFTIHQSRLFNQYNKELFPGVKTSMTVISVIETTVFTEGYPPGDRIPEENNDLNILNQSGQYGLIMD